MAAGRLVQALQGHPAEGDRVMARDYSDVPDLETARRLLVAYDETTRKCADEIERLRHALHMIATHPEIHLGAAEEMATIAEHALQQKESE